MSEQVKLEKTLSPMQVCALALGSIVGWGCFVLPGDMFLPKAGPLGTLYGFMIGAFLICFVAVCLSYMIKYAPVAGGAFAYAYIGFGPTAAFVCGWALVIGYIAIVAIDIAALSVIFRFLFPGIFEFGPLYAIAGWKVYTGEVLLMTAGTLIFGWVNYRGIGIAGKIQLVLAFMLTIGIVALFAGVVALDSSQLSNLTPGFSENGTPLSCVLLIFAISPFLFVGFDTVPQAAEEFSFDPARARNIMVCSTHQKAPAKGVPPEARMSNRSGTACPCRMRRCAPESVNAVSLAGKGTKFCKLRSICMKVRHLSARCCLYPGEV